MRREGEGHSTTTMMAMLTTGSRRGRELIPIGGVQWVETG